MSNELARGNTRDHRLDSWKCIAHHLGRSPRTIQRWHSDYGLPVRRLAGTNSSVFAYVNELDAWFKNRSTAAGDSSCETVRLKTVHSQVQDLSDSQTSLASKMWTILPIDNLRTITCMYWEAIDRDPGSALAFAGLSLALIALGLSGEMEQEEAFSSAKSAMERATELDSSLLEVRCAAVWVMMASKRG